MQLLFSFRFFLLSSSKIKLNFLLTEDRLGRALSRPEFEVNSGTLATISTKIQQVKSRKAKRGKVKSYKPRNRVMKKARILSDAGLKDHIVSDDYLVAFAGLLAGAALVLAGAAGLFAGAALVFAGAALVLAGAALVFAGAVFAGAALVLAGAALVLAGLFAAALLAGAASPQAIPSALRPRTVESTITFFISRTSLLSSSKVKFA